MSLAVKVIDVFMNIDPAVTFAGYDYTLETEKHFTNRRYKSGHEGIGTA